MNVMSIFLISGLWHGANWTFVIWGALNAMYMIIAFYKNKWELITRVRKSIPEFILIRYDSLMVFFLFGFSLFIFRANDFGDTMLLLSNSLDNTIAQISSVEAFSNALATMEESINYWLIIGIGMLFLFLIDGQIQKREIGDVFQRLPKPWSVMLHLIILISILYLGAFATPENFVYFQF